MRWGRGRGGLIWWEGTRIVTGYVTGFTIDEASGVDDGLGVLYTWIETASKSSGNIGQYECCPCRPCKDVE